MVGWLVRRRPPILPQEDGRMKSEPTRVLVVGCGDLGRRVAALHRGRGDAVIGLVRGGDSAARLESAGVAPLVADLDATLPALPTRGAFVYYFAPPPETGIVDPRVGRFLHATRRDGPPARLVYVSTTGVYGDCGGAWVDETWPARPAVDRARRRWDAECRLREWAGADGGDLVILRVAGIYGPGRLPLGRLRQGLPMVAPEEAPWTNRIHADDLATVCVAAMDRAPAGALYNASDGCPGNMADYFNRVADLAGLPRPPVVRLAEADGRLSAGLLSYLQESRRLSNRRMLEELGVRLRYPTLDQGLPASLAAETTG
jgi:nucleoside-diphosphate-sugar epimerase